VDEWRAFDNSSEPIHVAEGGARENEVIYLPKIWEAIHGNAE